METNTTIRGAFFDIHERELCDKVQELFQKYSANRTLSYEDLYGGKLCAALDRQHPRDLFDVHQLLKGTGFTKSIISAFIGYLVSHPRPMNELLNPNFRDFVPVMEKEFAGMTVEDVDATELNALLFRLPGMITSRLTRENKEFLLSFKEGSPDHNLLPIPNLMDFPAVQWKLQNIRKMDGKKHREQVEKLAGVLGF
ncbi:MAG: nucleotidyl transferase AbiEii/AbiGii toxin family protein [Balneolales bacterium]